MAVKRYINGQWITISGLQGAAGQTGLQGPQGPAGATGATGATGPAGPANTLSIGTVTNGVTAAASITGSSPNQVLNLVLPLNTNALTLTGSQTVTNKTITLGSNTITGTLAEFNTALTDADFATLAGTETLTNKTLTSATLTSPSLTGTPTAPTAASNNNSTQIATTAFVQTAVANRVTTGRAIAMAIVFG